MKKWCVFLLTIIAVFSMSLTAVAAVPQATDMENYVGNPGMFVSQEADGIHVKVDAQEGGTFTTAWGYNCEQKMDGLTITLKNLKMSAADESGLCIALGNYEGAYYGDRCLMFVLNASTDDGSWVFCGYGNGEQEVINMAGTEIYGFNNGMDVTFKWEKVSENSWVWKINDKEFRFSDADVKAMIDDEEFMFVSFGGWNPVTNIDYTITGVGQEEDLQKPDDSKPAGTDDTANTTTVQNTDAGGNGLPVGILVVIIVMAVLLVAVTGLLVYFLVIKPKKSV